jgi:hypothetical protein
MEQRPYLKTSKLRNRLQGINSASLCSQRSGTSDRIVVKARQAGNRFLGLGVRNFAFMNDQFSLYVLP